MKFTNKSVGTIRDMRNVKTGGTYSNHHFAGWKKPSGRNVDYNSGVWHSGVPWITPQRLPNPSTACKMYGLYATCITRCRFGKTKSLWAAARVLAISQYPEGPATGHLDTGFSWFPWVQERMLRWFPPFQVASTCFSCSPPDLNSVVTNCLLSYM